MCVAFFSLGIISDTHGLVRPELFRELAGVDMIVHAGDIGKPAVLEELKRIAPVIAVRGNVDRGPWTDALRETELVELFPGRTLFLLHDIEQLDLDPKATGVSAVVCGHSHKPSISETNGVLYLNPGSAGPRRCFSLPVTLMRAEITPDTFVPRLIKLDL
jgi:hypothetical protein